MEKLKEILGVLKRQHFWFIAPILFAVGIAGWWMASNKLTDEFQRNRATVDAYVQKMQTVTSQQPHPNTEYHEGMGQLIANRSENIRAAWSKKWERQKTELVWPQELPPDFLRQVDNMRPIESVTTTLPAPSRRAYANFVKDVLPKLAARIGAVWNPAARAAGGFRGSRTARREGGESSTEATTAVVDWNPGDQAKWRDKFSWGAAPPNTKEVLYAQEDLWVLSTLFDIIQRTNGDAITRSQAAVKGIEFIQIGADVEPPSRQPFRVTTLQPMQTDEGDDDDDDDDEPAEAPMDFGGDFVPMEGGAPAAAPDLVVNRYYDKTYEPIADLPTLKRSVTVAKRVPVRMRLRMDQRSIAPLLVECANAPLTFEVRQVRYNPRDGGRPGQMAMGEFAEGFQGIGRRQAAKMLSNYQSFDRTVELFGIVYIFNPVNDAVLAGEVVAESVEEDESAWLRPVDRRWLR